MATKCPICGAAALTRQSGNFRFTPPENIPGGEIVIENATWDECSSCEERILTLELEQSLEAERYSRLGLLTPDEIKEIRKRLGLNQVEMAQLLGVGDKSYTRWETGASIQNKSNDNLIRLVSQNPGLLTQLEAQRQPGRDVKIAEYLKSLGQIKGGNLHALAAHGNELTAREAEAIQKIIKDRKQD